MAAGDHACLLIHGINGGPYDLEGLADHLRSAGVAAQTILLPGHEIAAHEAMRFGWDDWLAAAGAAFDDLARRYRRVSVLGHSMGGAVALSLAARENRVAALVALCPPAELHPALLPVVAVAHRLVPFLPKIYEDIRGHRERWAYMRRPHPIIVPSRPLLSLLRALPVVRASLPNVRCPALVIAARHDHVVPARDSILIHRRLGSAHKELLILDHSWHIITHDVERHLVFAKVADFLARVVPPAGRADGFTRWAN